MNKLQKKWKCANGGGIEGDNHGPQVKGVHNERDRNENKKS